MRAEDPDVPFDSLALPDLASRALRGSVVAASDEFFAEKENLIKPGVAVYTPQTFGHKGQVYDGWETRRRRGPDGGLPAADEHDWVIVRLGAAGVVHAVVVDTAYFTGNFPQACTVEACYVDGYPSAAELEAARWTEIVPRSRLKGDTPHVFEVAPQYRYSHVRLRIYPDGGVARLRVHGRVVPDPRLLEGLTFDLAALENGGDVEACSDRFYSAPRNVIAPGLSRVMGEGWETRRRREPGNEWLTVRFAARSVVQLAELDTSGYIGNAPGSALLRGFDPAVSDSAGTDSPPGHGEGSGPGQAAGPAGLASWFELLPRSTLQPDTPHRFRLADPRPVESVRLDVFPDGGVARLRLYGTLTPEGLAEVRRRWAQTAP